jgi:murein DD-endopeptidase MepM/ murein hydrolase activator NlpD
LKRTVTVIRFRPQGGAEQFYSPQGESVVRSFLRTPMDASHITSRFGWREHPILGYSALHTGVDFAAPRGTPVLAAGAGKVKMAGYNGGYGLYVRLDHTAQIGTGYGHLSRLGPGIKPGVAVRQGQVIGFVGSTGMSTGAHLHYEFYRANAPVNPLARNSRCAPAWAARTSRASRARRATTSISSRPRRRSPRLRPPSPRSRRRLPAATDKGPPALRCWERATPWRSYGVDAQRRMRHRSGALPALKVP